MDIKESAAFLIAVNQVDPRVQSNAVADKTWHHSISVLTKDEAWLAFLEFKRGNTHAPSPAEIRKGGLVVRSRWEAQQRAIEAPRRRAVDPRPDRVTWDRLVAEGAAAAKAAKAEREGRA